MKSHTHAPITSGPSFTEQLGIHDLTENELEQVVGAQSWGHDHDWDDKHRYDWDDKHRYDWDDKHRYDWDDKHRYGWGYHHDWDDNRGWRR